MIKPTRKITYLAMSLLALMPGWSKAFTLDLHLNQDNQWSQLQNYLTQVDLITQSFSRFKELVRTRKISKLNLRASKQFLVASNLEETQMHANHDAILNNLAFIIPQLQQYIQESLHPSYIKKHTKQSMTSYSLSIKEAIRDVSIKQDEPDFEDQKEQQFLPTRSNQIKTVVKSGLRDDIRQTSTNSRISVSQSPNASLSSIKKADLQTRVLIAQSQKVTRLDKILGLRVKKPVVQSVVRLNSFCNQSNSKINTDQKSILIEEINKNREEMKQIKREEQNFKWQVEREAKEISRIEQKERENDDISRYRQVFDQKHHFKNILEASNKSPLVLEKFSSNKKSERSKENRVLAIQESLCERVVGNQIVICQQHEQLVVDLRNELVQSQRTKDRMKEKLQKTIQNCYMKSENDPQY